MVLGWAIDRDLWYNFLPEYKQAKYPWGHSVLSYMKVIPIGVALFFATNIHEVP